MDGLFEPLLPQSRVARLLGIEADTLGSWRRRGYGPRWYRVGKKIMYSQTDLLAWVHGQERGVAYQVSEQQPDTGGPR